MCNKDKCKKVYIGESKRMLWARLADHCGYISRGEADKATGAHFSQPGHSLADLRITVLENTRGKTTEYRREREHYYIRRFNTFHEGLNKQNKKNIIEGRGGFSLFLTNVFNYFHK